MNPIYQMVEICITEDFKYYIQYTGEVAEQGGTIFGTGNFIVDNLDDALDIAKIVINRNLNEYKKRIEERKISEN